MRCQVSTCAGLFLVRDRLVRAHGAVAPVTGRLDPSLVDTALGHEIAADHMPARLRAIVD